MYILVLWPPSLSRKFHLPRNLHFWLNFACTIRSIQNLNGKCILWTSYNYKNKWKKLMTDRNIIPKFINLVIIQVLGLKRSQTGRREEPTSKIIKRDIFQWAELSTDLTIKRGLCWFSKGFFTTNHITGEALIWFYISRVWEIEANAALHHHQQCIYFFSQ